MLYLNFKRIFSIRGINKPQHFLVSNGFTPSIVARILHNEASHIKMEYLERICELLKCTPNDIFDYQPNKNTTIPKDHPLYTLRKDLFADDLHQHFQDASFDELKEIQNLIQQQKNKKNKS